MRRRCGSSGSTRKRCSRKSPRCTRTSDRGWSVMRVVSWNVNGLRACAKKGFAEFLETSKADVVGIQEVRADPAQLDPETCFPQGWQAWFAPAVRPGYSGVAI